MGSRERVTSAFTPDLVEIRAWLQKMIATLKFVEMVTAIVALIGRMRDLNTELVAQLAQLRRAPSLRIARPSRTTARATPRRSHRVRRRQTQGRNVLGRGEKEAPRAPSRT
jgi:hypothetical protein